MRIAIAAPLALAGLGDLLDDDVPSVRAIGGGTPIAHLVRGLLGRGHEVTVVTGDIGRATEVVLTGPGLRIHVGPYRAQHRARDAFAVERAYVARSLAAAAPDVVHAHWTYEFALGALASGRPTIVTVRDWAPTILRYQPDPYRAVRLMMNAAVLARARHLTVTSPYMRARVRRWTRREPPLVPNAVHDRDFVGREDLADAGAATRAPRAVSINNGFGRRKNVGTLLRAWPRVTAVRPGARLELIGHGYEPDGPAASWAAERSLDRDVVFRGPRPNAETMARLAGAALLAHPSREESFGLVLVEAMARGVPVVAGRDAGAVPWILDEGRAGVLADVTDPAELAGAILRSLEDVDATEARRRHAYDRAWERFRLSVALDGYERLYTRVAAT